MALKKDHRVMIVPDLQIPFHVHDALEFISKIYKREKCDEIVCVGDELDLYFYSQFKRHPEMRLSPLGEIDACIKELKRWYKVFPQMKLATSNHGRRLVKKALEADIPSQLLRRYRDIIDAPTGWRWKDDWIIKTGSPFRIYHGCGYSGARGHINAALDARISTAIGHLHSFGGHIAHINTMGSESPIWAANVGCLIDTEALAFEYGKKSRNQPVLGCVTVVDDGRKPVFHPYET